MLQRFFSRFSKDLAVDLGTSRTLIYVKDQGIVINEPSIVAINLRNDHILSVGEEAYKMLGRTPSHIVATKPLVDGVVSDFEATERMLKYFLDRVREEMGGIVSRPRVVIGIPLQITEVERKAVEDAARGAGAREVFLIEQVIAAAIGARLPIQDPVGNVIVDSGAGTTEIAVISSNGIVTSRSLKTAGDDYTEGLIQYVREDANVLLGERTAEEMKLKIGAAAPLEERLEMHIRGRDLLTGLPKEILMTSDKTRESFIRLIKIIIDNIRATLEETPPELISDIHRKGIVLCGGSSLLRGFSDMLVDEFKIPIHIADDPTTCVVRGLGFLLSDAALLRELSVNTPSA
ncbi:MAG: rod shape-determining protein [bacterium]|nr:rod shape-determining protein [bacterium]